MSEQWTFRDRLRSHIARHRAIKRNHHSGEKQRFTDVLIERYAMEPADLALGICDVYLPDWGEPDLLWIMELPTDEPVGVILADDGHLYLVNVGRVGVDRAGWILTCDEPVDDIESLARVVHEYIGAGVLKDGAE